LSHQENQTGKDMPVTPLATALLAASWLAFVSVFLWWGRRLQLTGKPRLVYVPARRAKKG
jgi:hypothetical protein